MSFESSHDDLILEPLDFNDIKWNVSNDEHAGVSLPETDEKQVKFLSAALSAFRSKRKRESSTSSGSPRNGKGIHHWRHALLKARSFSDPWESFKIEEYPTEKALRHRYYPLKKQWNVDEVEVKMQPEVFAQGAMRECYRIKKLSNFSHNRDWRNNCNNAVAKRFMDPVDRDVYFSEVKLQMEAKLWGEEYNRHNPPKKVDFFLMAVLEFVDRPNCPLFHVENYIEGHYVKYNSNSGFVLESQSHLRATPQAFSHFTFERSGHEIMVVDIQGVGDLYTDPQIHTVSGLEYGDGNLGTRGMALFFHSHTCNTICESLGLTQFDLAPSELALLSAPDHHHSPLVGTISRGTEDICVLPSAYEKSHLTEFLRKRSTSTSISHDSCSSPADLGGEWTSADVAEDDPDDDEPSDGKTLLTGKSPTLSESSNVDSDRAPRRRPRMNSDAGSGSLSEEADRLAFRKLIEKKARSSCVLHELEARKRQLEMNEEDIEDDAIMQRTGGSVLGQLHLDLAKYHEMQRFTEADKEGYDKEAAFYHLKHAADCGNLEGIITMSRIALHLPHDVLTDLEMEESVENTDLGLDYMHNAADAGDRAAMIYLAKAYDTGLGLGTREVYWPMAVHFYGLSISSIEASDEEGHFDGSMDDPPYQLMARLAEMYLEGAHGLQKNPTEAADLFNQAAESAMASMKGRLANKYYAMAEEASALIDE